MLVSGGDQHRPERSGESCHGVAVTEGILTSDSMALSACDYPFHRSRLSARLLCAGGTRPATTELTNENGSERLLCPSGARSAMSEATAEFSTGDLPPTGTRSPLKGVLVSGGDRSAPTGAKRRKLSRQSRD